MMSISEMEKLLEENKHIKLQLKSLNISYSAGGIKTDGGWNDMLKRIKKANRGSTINTGNISQI